MGDPIYELRERKKPCYVMWIVHLLKNKSCVSLSLAHLHVAPNLNDFLSSVENNRRYFEEYGSVTKQLIVPIDLHMGKKMQWTSMGPNNWLVTILQNICFCVQQKKEMPFGCHVTCLTLHTFQSHWITVHDVNRHTHTHSSQFTTTFHLEDTDI